MRHAREAQHSAIFLGSDVADRRRTLVPAE
jgi:hypothetical protein